MRPRPAQSHAETEGRLKTHRTASVVIRGHAFTQNLRRGHYELPSTPRRCSGRPPHSTNRRWDEDACHNLPLTAHPWEVAVLMQRPRSPACGWVRSSSMEENKARRVVDALRERGTNADLAMVGTNQVGVTIRLPDGREAIWDSDDTASLEAQVMRNGVLVGFVPEIEGSGSSQMIRSSMRSCAPTTTSRSRSGVQPHRRPHRRCRSRVGSSDGSWTGFATPDR